MMINQTVNSFDESSFHSVLKQNYIQSQGVLLNIILGSVAGHLGMRDDLFYKMSRLVAFYYSERSVQFLWNAINPYFDRR
jgi:hypothetical protein